MARSPCIQPYCSLTTTLGTGVTPSGVADPYRGGGQWGKSSPKEVFMYLICQNAISCEKKSNFSSWPLPQWGEYILLMFLSLVPQTKPSGSVSGHMAGGTMMATFFQSERKLEGSQLFGCIATRTACCKICIYCSMADPIWDNFFSITR